LFVLAFYSGWEYRKTYTHLQTPVVPYTSYKNFVNFCPVTSDILWHVCVVSTKVYGLIFTNLSANVGRLKGFVFKLLCIQIATA